MTIPNLTSDQWDQLIEQYVDLCLDSMDYKCMELFIRETLTEDFEQIQSRHELLDEIRLSFDEETLNELLDSVTTVTYGLKEGETLSFPVHDPTK